MASPEAKTPARRRRKAVLVSAIAAGLGMMIAGAAIWKALAHRQPSPTGDPVAIAKFAATPDFAQLSIEQRAQYLKTLRANLPTLVAAARAGKLSRQEQINAVRNGVKAGARVEVLNYFALPAGPARQAMLDRLIDEQEQLRGYAAQAREGGPLQFDAGVELKQFVETLPPGERVQMAQFGFDLFKRRLERGLPIWPYGH